MSRAETVASALKTLVIMFFKILNDLAPTYLLELIEKRCRTRNLRNSENILRNPLMNKFFFAFCPLKSGTLARGIENNQIPQNFQRWPASLFFHLFESIIRGRSLTKCDKDIQLLINDKSFFT